MQVEANEPILLNLQLWDGNPNKFVKAFLTNPSGAAYGSPVNLISVGNGLYLNNSLNMPTLQALFVTYIVYTDAGYSIEDSAYTFGRDSFELAVSGGGGGSSQSIACAIKGIVLNAAIAAKVTPNRLDAAIKNTQVIGVVRPEELKADLKMPTIKSSISGDKITGRVEC